VILVAGIKVIAQEARTLPTGGYLILACFIPSNGRSYIACVTRFSN
jgi:hypothetical protein